MKRFAFAFGVLAFALACSDATTAPTTRAALSAHTLASGRIPPPPVDAGVDITITSSALASSIAGDISTPFFLEGAFNGVYFDNGQTAWLRLDNAQPDPFGTSASANARFMASGTDFSGHGTLVIDGHVVTIDEVHTFFANPDCDLSGGASCASITFDATVDGESGHQGTAIAFNRAFCQFFPGEVGGVYRCGGE